MLRLQKEHFAFRFGEAKGGRTCARPAQRLSTSGSLQWYGHLRGRPTAGIERPGASEDNGNDSTRRRESRRKTTTPPKVAEVQLREVYQLFAECSAQLRVQHHGHHRHLEHGVHDHIPGTIPSSSFCSRIHFWKWESHCVIIMKATWGSRRPEHKLSESPSSKYRESRHRNSPIRVKITSFLTLSSPDKDR